MKSIPIPELAGFDGYVRIASRTAQAAGLRVTVEFLRFSGDTVVWRGSEAAFRALPEFARLGPFPTGRTHRVCPGRLRGYLHVDPAAGGFRFELGGVFAPNPGTRSIGAAVRAALADEAYMAWRERLLDGAIGSLPASGGRR